MKYFYRQGKYEGWIGFDWKSWGLGINLRDCGKQISIYLPFFEFYFSYYGKRKIKPKSYGIVTQVNNDDTVDVLPYYRRGES